MNDEEKLSNPKKTIEIIQKYQFRFQKKFGQNFLIDSHVIRRMIDAAHITNQDFVLEIGPGIGTLTQYLAENAREVMAVEIDRSLLPILDETLSSYSNVTVVNQDILKMDIAGAARRNNGGKKIKVAANLPYYITTPVMMSLLEKRLPIESITVMVQKEVAMRMQAGPGTRDYGALSLAVQYYSKPSIAASVPPNCFIPRPNVGSAVIHLECLDQPPVSVKDERMLFRVIRASFNQRRKTMVNALCGSADLNLTKQEAAEALTAAGLPANVRGEQLTLEQFAKAADALADQQAGA